MDDAVRALELIVKQGEGTSISPLDPEGEFAHYYSFAEIYYGRQQGNIHDLAKFSDQ